MWNEIRPKVITTFTFFNNSSSRIRYSEQLANSEFSGLFEGGAHLTHELMKTLFRIKPSSIDVLSWLFEKPVSYKALISHCPEWSPVKSLPVLLAPWAPGARPIISTFPFISPNPVTGFAQYTSFENRLTLFLPTVLMYVTNLLHRVQLTTSLLILSIVTKFINHYTWH